MIRYGILLCTLPLLLVSCITIVVSPTPTPIAELALPSITRPPATQPVASATRPIASTPSQSQTTTTECIAWREARTYVGKNTCVTGTVTRVFTDARSKVTFIDFSNERTAYMGFSPQLTWDASLVGKCVRIFGLITLYNDRPETVVNSREQIVLC